MKQFLFLLCILGMLVTACGGNSSLQGTAWNLTSIRGQAVVAGSSATLAFDDKNVSGNSSCNSFGGEYSAGTKDLAIGLLMTTLMACMDDGVMEQEAAYMGALAEVKSYELAGDALTLLDGDGQVLLVFVRQ